MKKIIIALVMVVSLTSISLFPFSIDDACKADCCKTCSTSCCGN